MQIKYQSAHSFNWCVPPQLAAPRDPDPPPRPAGDSGLHADAVRHVLQRLDLPRGHRGLHARLFHLLPPPGSRLTLGTNSDHPGVVHTGYQTRWDAAAGCLFVFGNHPQSVAYYNNFYCFFLLWFGQPLQSVTV